MKTKASYISVHSGQVFFFFWWGGVRFWCQMNYRKDSGFGCQNYGWGSRNLYTNHSPVAVQWQSPHLGFHGSSHFDLLYTNPCFLILLNHKMYMVSSCAQSCQTLCDPRDCSPPGCSVCGISPDNILEWVAISFSRGSSRPKDQTHV